MGDFILFMYIQPKKNNISEYYDSNQEEKRSFITGEKQVSNWY